MDGMDMPLDLHTVEPDEPDGARWVPSQSTHPELQALIKQAEQDKLTRPAISCLAEPLWTHAPSTLWSSPAASRTPSLPLFADASSSSLLLDSSHSEPSSLSSSARRVKPYSAHAHRKPLSVSVNHAVHSKRSGLKQEPLSKRPRSSSHSVSHVAKESHEGGGTKTLADREQHPDAAAFLALVRSVSEQLDENSRKKQRIAIETVKEREKIRTKYGQGNDQRTPILPRSGIVPKQDKGKGREDPRVIENSTEKASNTRHNINLVQGHIAHGAMSNTARSLTRVSSMDPNTSRQAPITDSRNLSRASSSATISLTPYRAETAPSVIDLTQDDANLKNAQEPLESVGRNTSRGHGPHVEASPDESFMLVDSDTNSGCNTDIDVDMDTSIHPKGFSCPDVDTTKPPSTTQQQLSTGQGRPGPPRRPQLGMRRPPLLSSNTQRNPAQPHPSQYSIPSHVPKSTTVPRFKPPLLGTSGQKVPAQKVSAGSGLPRPRLGGGDTQDRYARRQNEMTRLTSDTDPDSSFDISFDLDMDVLEEAMRPYD